MKGERHLEATLYFSSCNENKRLLTCGELIRRRRILSLMQMNGTLYFVLCLLLLIVGYWGYGRFVERIFDPDLNRKTPAVDHPDGVDYVVMPGWKIFFIQLLNIAGLGPVYGAILGALYGPVAMLWIVLGCILAGAVHDYCSGMMSLRRDGASLPELIDGELGKMAGKIIRYLCIALIILVGVVFAIGPAQLLANMTGMSMPLWAGIIFLYYFAATILPIDVLIGRIYPFFAICLIFMAVSMLMALFFVFDGIMPNCTISVSGVHPDGSSIWPMLFITIACGAISGFHATQSPLMARCMKSEGQGRPIFYGAMVAEGVIALIWCAVGLTFYQSPQELNEAMPGGNAGKVVFDSTQYALGHIGSILAILGVVVLPITSGDTALRSARLMIADALHLPQKNMLPRLCIAVPLLAVCLIMTRIEFGVIWRYFGWFNQCIACFTLWSIAVYLRRSGKFHWLATVPAVFLTAVCLSYLLTDKNCFELPWGISSIAASLVAVGLAVMMPFQVKPKLGKD